MRAHEAGALHAAGYGGPPIWLPYPRDVMELLPQLWAQTVCRGADGRIQVGGVDVVALADEFGTAAYVLDEADFRSRARAFHDEFQAAFAHVGGADVYYAGKAFLCTEVARWVEQEGLCLDVCTGGELAVAIRAGFPGERIALHGNNKSTEEIRIALSYGVGRIVVDSFDEIDRILVVARESGVVAPVMVRTTVGVEAHTHEFIATGHEDQKFGFSLAGGTVGVGRRRRDPRAARRDAPARLPQPHRQPDLRHDRLRAGRASAGRLACRRRERFGGGPPGDRPRRRVRHRLHLPAPPARPRGSSPSNSPTSSDASSPRPSRAGTRAVPRVSIEPGRAIAGPSTFTLYEVGTIKDVALGEGYSRRYVSVDGGMSDNIRPALYEADYSVTLASRDSQAAPRLSRVVGRHCESGDIVVLDEYLPADLALGDLLAVPGTGAYCRSMCNQYNHTPRPPVIAVRDGVARVLVRRETIDDLLALDVG